MGNTTSPNQRIEDIDQYRLLEKGDELINGRGVHGIYLGREKGVAVCCLWLRGICVVDHDLFKYDKNPEWSLKRINYDDGDEREKKVAVALQAEQRIVKNRMVRFLSLWIGLRRNIRTIFI